MHLKTASIKVRRDLEIRNEVLHSAWPRIGSSPSVLAPRISLVHIQLEISSSEHTYKCHGSPRHDLHPNLVPMFSRPKLTTFSYMTIPSWALQFYQLGMAYSTSLAAAGVY